MAKTKTIENLFNLIAHLSELFPLTLFLLFWKKSKIEKGLSVIAFYCLFAFAINFALKALSNTSIILFYSMFTICEYLFFATFLYINIKNPKARLILKILSLLFCFFLIFYYSTVKFDGLDSIPIGVETILILMFSFYYLFEQMNDTTNLFIYSKYQFWIILGILLYLAGSFFIYIFAGQLKAGEIEKYWVFTNIFSILKNIFFVVAIIVNSNQSSTKKSHSTMYHLN